MAEERGGLQREGGQDDAGPLREALPELARCFPDGRGEAAAAACRRMTAQGLGAAAVAYARTAPACVRMVGAGAALALAASVEALGRTAGPPAALALAQAAAKAARRLGTAEAFAAWLGVVEELAAAAPESVSALLGRIEGVLVDLDVPRFEGWVLAGLRMAGGDPARRRAYFALEDPEALRWLERAAADLGFSAVERRLKAYLLALWRLRAPIRPVGAAGSDGPPRRVSFASGIIRVPESFRGYEGPVAMALFRASLAHVAAHFRFTRRRFAVGRLKPLQVALVSLVEDARVEQLAMAEFPGLRRLWLPFHVAEPGDAPIAPSLMARLSRALVDPAYQDDDAWVRKGRQLFFDTRDRWDDPAISRHIGGLLGNDLGQMRVQFNARTYVVEPVYRDDNAGLWDFGDRAPSPGASDTLVESVRIDRIDDSPAPDRRRPDPQPQDADDGAPHRAAEDTQDAPGVPVARYPEWDHLIAREREDWTTVVDYPAEPGDPRKVDRVLEERPDLAYRIRALVRSAKVSRPVRLRRQSEGDRLDLNACVGAAVTRRLGQSPDPRVYETSVRRDRDLSVLVLLDVSESTNDKVLGGITSVLGLERDATALLAHGMAELGDPFAIHAFCSNGREEVRYLRVKDFGRPYDAAARARLAGLRGGLSTRIGAALRHAGAALAPQLTHRRLLLCITDGEPSDIDVFDRRYLVEDARHTVMALSRQGIDTFCVGLDTAGEAYLTRIFGRRNVLQVDRLDRLPETLPSLYFRLTA
ncbi:MAG TPA: hypothetical protein VD995_03815 [Azospirillum sp.]|nr:hypothetical protein [Azospirillum sp.]